MADDVTSDEDLKLHDITGMETGSATDYVIKIQDLETFLRDIQAISSDHFDSDHRLLVILKIFK
jgi:hypothetical protein